MTNNDNIASEGIDWKNLAQFWQAKYQDQLLHFTQVITVLNRSMLVENAQHQQQQVQAAASQNGDSSVLEPETADQS